jgi:hypothetical protein
MHALEGILDLVPVHSRADAWVVLEQEAADIDLIISTIAFDESRMVEFLQAVRPMPSSAVYLSCARESCPLYFRTIWWPKCAKSVKSLALSI